jgi:pimeloyl-ACP methyl ester carboxylesterase
MVLVGHSYGGAVITAAASGNPNVKALVYVAAMAPDEGETVGELLHRAAPHPSTPVLVPDEDGFLWMSPKGFADAVAHESSADDALLMAATQKPVAIKCVQEHMTKPAWKEKPAWFLVAERDRMIAPETQRFMAHRTGGHILAMEVDHTPLASAPDGVVAIINDVVDTVAHEGRSDARRIRGCA